VPPILLHIVSQGVIPAKSGIQLKKLDSPTESGMTNKVKGLLTQRRSK